MKIFSFINRRNFLKFLGLFSITNLISPLKLMFGNENKSSSGKIKYAGNVIIIGAGAAGLYAGQVLKSKGIQFQILEASDRYGGRLGQLKGFASYSIDLGAQWLHGKNNIVGKLIQKSKTSISLDSSKPKYWFKKKLQSSLPKNIEIFSGDLPDLSYQDFSKLKGLDEDFKYIIESLAGDKGASASRLSAYYDNLEFENWNSGDENYKFQETYFSLIDEQIASTVKDKIKLNTVISKIDYSKSKIVITDTKKNIYFADKLILTVPITILKAGDIELSETSK